VPSQPPNQGEQLSKELMNLFIFSENMSLQFVITYTFVKKIAVT
jgi:hypothetical protein